MEVTPESIIVNSCEYTPVYLIPNPGVTQAGQYIITQSNNDVQKPVSDNLKTFYENSGNLENGVLSSPKPRILKKQSSNVIGNNLKLASFLIPKTEPNVPVQTTVPVQPLPTKQYTTPAQVNNVVLKPTVTPSSTNTINMVPRVEVERKIVRVGSIPFTTKTTNHVRVLPKIKPKENSTSNSTKHTSVQLLKLGETYHSLNQLSDDQMKIVNHALKMFSDPEKIPKEPAYDPITNTKFIYKVVSPRDLTVVGKNKVVIKKKSELKKKKEPEILQSDEEKLHAEPTVTRSGRTVKPKQMVLEETPQKPRKKNGSVVTCFQCSAEFCSLYRLQRHYENYPTHIPAKTHTNLFHCLLAIIKGGSDEDQANIFIQQLEQLIEKLKMLLPCLLKKIDGREGKLCTVNDDIGRLFGMNPGKYNLNMEALNCVKDKDGHCIHNPPPKNNLNHFSADMSKPSQLWLSKHNEEIANNEAGTEDCARINSVDKWPTVSKRIWKFKQQKSQKINAKRMRLASEEPLIELGIDDVVTFSKPDESAINVAQNKNVSVLESNDSKENTVEQPIAKEKLTSIEDQSKKPKVAHIQFHSAHFDIRSSPIKPSALMRKFQFHPDKLSTFEVQIMRPSDKSSENENVIEANTNTSAQLQGIFRDSDLTKANDINSDLNFDKSWTMASEPNDGQSHDDYIKANILFESTLTPVKGNLIEPSLIHITDKPDTLFEPPSTTSSLLEQTLIQTKSNSIMDSPMMLLKDKSNCLFEQSSMHIDNNIHAKDTPNTLYESSLIHSSDKTNDVFESALSRVKERSHSLFEQSLMHTKDKNSLIGPSLIHEEKTHLYESSITHGKSDSLLESTLMHMKDKSDSLLEPPMHMKDDKNSMNLDVSQSDHMNTNDSRLLSNQGHSVLNFLETLGNELAYPETEIRNNSVDFDLFSFSSS